MAGSRSQEQDSIVAGTLQLGPARTTDEGAQGVSPITSGSHGQLGDRPRDLIEGDRASARDAGVGFGASGYSRDRRITPLASPSRLTSSGREAPRGSPDRVRAWVQENERRAGRDSSAPPEGRGQGRRVQRSPPHLDDLYQSREPLRRRLLGEPGDTSGVGPSGNQEGRVAARSRNVDERAARAAEFIEFQQNSGNWIRPQQEAIRVRAPPEEPLFLEDDPAPPERVDRPGAIAGNRSRRPARGGVFEVADRVRRENRERRNEEPIIRDRRVDQERIIARIDQRRLNGRGVIIGLDQILQQRREGRRGNEMNANRMDRGGAAGAAADRAAVIERERARDRDARAAAMRMAMDAAEPDNRWGGLGRWNFGGRLPGWANMLGGGPAGGEAINRGNEFDLALMQAQVEAGMFGGFAADLGVVGGMFQGYAPAPGPTIEDQWKDIVFKPRKVPLAGYTFDLDKEEVPAVEIISLDGSDQTDTGRLGADKSKEKKLSLVCCNCMAPLRVSQGQKSPDDRVIALQCGHLIDQRCLKRLSTPKPKEEPGPSTGNFVIVSSARGTSSAKPFASEDTLLTTRGRPRTTSLIDLANSPPRIGSSLPIANPPRRLTRAAAHAMEPIGHVGGAPIADDKPILDAPDLKRKRGQQMSATAMKKIKVPKESRVHEWACPVAGCGMVHTSHEIGGVWETKKDTVVTLFV